MALPKTPKGGVTQDTRKMTAKTIKTLSDADARQCLLKAMLKRGEAWECPNCKQINGNHNSRCWRCRNEAA